MKPLHLINGREPANAGRRSLLSGVARELETLGQTLVTAGNNFRQSRPSMAGLYHEQARAVQQVAERFQTLAAKAPNTTSQNGEALPSSTLSLGS